MKQVLLMGLLAISACALQPIATTQPKSDYPPAAWGPVMDESSLQNYRFNRAR